MKKILKILKLLLISFILIGNANAVFRNFAETRRLFTVEGNAKLAFTSRVVQTQSGNLPQLTGLELLKNIKESDDAIEGLTIFTDTIRKNKQTTNFLADDLERLSRVLSMTDFPTKDIVSALESIGRISKAAKRPGSNITQAQVDTLMAKLTRKSSKGANATKRLNEVKGAIAEVLILDGVIKGNFLQRFQLIARGGIAHRDAFCKGGILEGEYFLEIKNWIKTSRSTGVGHLIDQVATHFEYYPRDITPLTKATIENDTAPGLVFQFAAHNGNLSAYRTAIEDAVRSNVRKELLNANVELSEVEGLIDTYLKKVIVKGV